MNTAPEVDGFTTEDPVPDDKWDDIIGYELLAYWEDLRHHDTAGWLAHFAGSPQCEALGHKPDPDDGWWDDPDNHPNGWDGEPMCIATRYGKACTHCEGECDFDRVDSTKFWALFQRRTTA